MVKACRSRERVAICGDYDADGMTSTALLLRALAPLGAEPEPAIPSRMEEGYGLNPAMVQRLYDDGVRLLVTVDNGVACLLYTSPSPRDYAASRMPSSA